MSPGEAAHKTIDEVGPAAVATALVLVAVFIPTVLSAALPVGSLHSSRSPSPLDGHLAFVALTLSPALGRVLFTKHVETPDAKGGLSTSPMR